MSRVLRPIAAGSEHEVIFQVRVDEKVIGNVRNFNGEGWTIQFPEVSRQKIAAAIAADPNVTWRSKFDTAQDAAVFLADALS
jgi:hypothetical protein